MTEPTREQREAAERWTVEGGRPADRYPEFIASLAALLAERETALIERCAKIVETPYGDAVSCYGSDEPLLVAAKMAAAIRALKDEP